MGRTGPPGQSRRGPSAGVGRDAWRSDRDPSPRAPERPVSGGRRFGGAEIEDLPAQVVEARGGARIGAGGMVALVGLFVLLAAGFGALGGRPESTAGASAAAVVATPGPTPTEAPVVPRVTPGAPCAGSPDSPPEIVLQVDGRSTVGRLEVLEFTFGGPTPDAAPDPIESDDPFDTDDPPDADEPPDTDDPLVLVKVPADGVTELRVVGGLCALAWNIDLADGRGDLGPDVLESVPNPERDPRHAAQNRFELVLAPYASDQLDYLLRAVLVFEDLVVRATWAVRVVPLDAPVAALVAPARRGDDVDIPMLTGCDVTLELANAWAALLNACDDDVAVAPAGSSSVRLGELLEFSIPDWELRLVNVACGALVERTFVVAPPPRPHCERDVDPTGTTASFAAPTAPGGYTIAITICANHAPTTGTGVNRLCGTWYANVRVRE